jgi:hypothetical protein
MAAAKRRSPVVRILIDNRKVRVHEVRQRPGHKGSMLALPNRVQYILKGGKQRVHYSNGRTKVQTLKPGTIVWRAKEKCASENIGKTEIRWIAVRLK